MKTIYVLFKNVNVTWGNYGDMEVQERIISYHKTREGAEASADEEMSGGVNLVKSYQIGYEEHKTLNIFFVKEIELKE